MKIMPFVVSLFASLIFILLGLEIVLPILRPEMNVLPILVINGLFLFGSMFYLESVEGWNKPEEYAIQNQILVGVYVFSFISIMIFIVLYFALDIARPVLYDLILLEIGLAIVSAFALKLD
jgi:hypothetical protein